jgi:hypothetical protein
MAGPATTEALIAFARAIRLDRRANPADAGDGTGLELLLAPRFQALLEILPQQPMKPMLPLPAEPSKTDQEQSNGRFHHTDRRRRADADAEHRYG